MKAMRRGKAIVCAFAVAMLLFLLARSRRYERFGINVGIARIRAALRGIGVVPAVSVPFASRSPEGAPALLERTPVWIDMFASETDDILRANDENSLTEVVWNEDHPMAGYVLGLDSRSIDLPRGLSAPFAELEERALGKPVRITADGLRVFSIPETYSTRNAQALCDLLYAATLVKLARNHGTAIAAIFAAADDLDTLRKESEGKLRAIEERGEQLRGEAEAEAAARWAAFEAEWQIELDANGGVAADTERMRAVSREEANVIARRDEGAYREEASRRRLREVGSAIAVESAHLRTVSNEGAAARLELARATEESAGLAETVGRAKAEIVKVAELRDAIERRSAAVEAMRIAAENAWHAKESAQKTLAEARAALDAERERSRLARERRNSARAEA
jgi:hypothetical protein